MFALPVDFAVECPERLVAHDIAVAVGIIAMSALHGIYPCSSKAFIDAVFEFYTDLMPQIVQRIFREQCSRIFIEVRKGVTDLQGLDPIALVPRSEDFSAHSVDHGMVHTAPLLLLGGFDPIDDVRTMAVVTGELCSPVTISIFNTQFGSNTFFGFKVRIGDLSG